LCFRKLCACEQTDEAEGTIQVARDSWLLYPPQNDRAEPRLGQPVSEFEIRRKPDDATLALAAQTIQLHNGTRIYRRLTLQKARAVSGKSAVSLFLSPECGSLRKSLINYYFILYISNFPVKTLLWLSGPCGISLNYRVAYGPMREGFEKRR
jgi:hypothetical protein